MREGRRQPHADTLRIQGPGALRRPGRFLAAPFHSSPMTFFRSSPLAKTNDQSQSGSLCTRGRRALQPAIEDEDPLRIALEERFPSLLKWVGHRDFRDAYASHRDSLGERCSGISEYSYGFLLSLARLFPNRSEVKELAWLEHARAEISSAGPSRPLRVLDARVAELALAKVQFVDSLKFAEGVTNAADIWTAIEQGTSPPDASIGSERHAYLAWKHDEFCFLRVVSLTEYRALCALYSGFRFGDLAPFLELCREPGVAGLTPASMLDRWLADGLIAGTEMATPN